MIWINPGGELAGSTGKIVDILDRDDSRQFGLSGRKREREQISATRQPCLRLDVPRMLRSTPRLRRGALLIRCPLAAGAVLGPGSAEQREERCTASGTRTSYAAFRLRMRSIRASSQ